DQRALDIGEDVAREVPPLHEEDPPPGRLEVVVHGHGQCCDVPAVTVHGDDVSEVLMERFADLTKDAQEGRRREPHRARELHVVPGERHVQRRRDEQRDTLRLACLGRSGTPSIFLECQTSCNTRASRRNTGKSRARPRSTASTSGTGCRETASRWCRSTVPDSATSTSLPRRRSSRSTSRSSTTTCAGTGNPTGRSSRTTWRCGRTTSPASWTRSSSPRRTSTAPRWAA